MIMRKTPIDRPPKITLFEDEKDVKQVIEETEDASPLTLSVAVKEIGYKFSNEYHSKNTEINYKYAEDRILADLKAHLDKTYDQHYMTENNVQCFDAWIALGDSTDTFRNTAIKYLWRYGKKNGNNKEDLLKAFHYVLMCLYVDHYNNKK